MNLGEIPLGGRLIVRSRKDWRSAVVSRIAENSITLSIASPKGYNYRTRRKPLATIELDGQIPILLHENEEDWRKNFTCYDKRW